MSAYLRNLDRKLEVKLTQDEKDMWHHFEGIMDDISELGSPEFFEPEPGFEDPDFDPQSASVGYDAGMESFAEELFERIVMTNRIDKKTLESLLLH